MATVVTTALTDDAGPSSPQANGRQPCQRRLHVSGLNPAQCTPADIQNRFSPFGLTVTNIDNWPPKQDAVGATTKWCFLTVHGQDGDIKRAASVLHNTMWKGSRIRIGNARPDCRQQHGDSREVGENASVHEDKRTALHAEKDTAKRQRARRRRGIVGVEDEKIDAVITAKDVQEGVWGWKETPAGHLVRPLHMRPERPIPTPTRVNGAPAEAGNGGGDEGDSSTKPKARKSKTSSNAIVRARRITIDPTRYERVHLSDALLDDDTSSRVPQGASWQYVEGEEDAEHARWVLVGRDGTVLKDEQAKQSNTSSLQPDYHAPPEDSHIDHSTEDGEGGLDFLDEIDAAIDQAESDSETDSLRGVDEATEAPEEAAMDETFVTAPDMSAGPIQYPHYDPEEDASFSDGYQEHQNDINEPAGTQDWAAEKHKSISILKKLFGDDSVQAVEFQQSPANASYDVTTEDPEVSETHVAAMSADNDHIEAQKTTQHAAQPTTAAGRRALLLGLLDPSATTAQRSSQFRPIERYDPAAFQEQDEDEGQEAGAEAEGQRNDSGDVEDADEAAPVSPSSKAHTMRADGHVQMTTLTDMFKPKESKGAGFSLLDDLDLDLDEDLDFDGGIDTQDYEAFGGASADRDQALGAPADKLPRAQPKGLPRLFPATDKDGHLLASDTSIFGVILERLRTAGVIQGTNVAAFLQPDDAATLAQKWETRKATLTQAYKRRHREAVKKKRRKYVGARAASGLAAATR